MTRLQHNKDEWIRQPPDQSFVDKMAAVVRAHSLVKFFAQEALRKVTRRTVLGWLWLPLRGLVPTLVGTIVMAGFLGVSSPHAPYPLFLLAGLIPWALFALTVTWTVRCLELSRRYLRAAAFPRLVLPIGYSTPAVLDVLMFAGTYLIALAWFAVGDFSVPAPGALTALWAISAFVTGLGWGMILCIPGMRMRDVRFTLAFVLSALFALTPVMYPVELVAPAWAWAVSVNPLATIVESFRSGLLGYKGPSVVREVIAISFATLSFSAGLFVFHRFENTIEGRI